MHVSVLIDVEIDSGLIQSRARARNKPIAWLANELAHLVECRLCDAVVHVDGVERVSSKLFIDGGRDVARVS